MLVRPLPGGDGVPQHGRKNGTQSRQIPDDAVIDEIVQGRHQTLVQERIDKLPIGRVPADQEHFPGERFTHADVHGPEKIISR
jgi:hypothetical protein